MSYGFLVILNYWSLSCEFAFHVLMTCYSAMVGELTSARQCKFKELLTSAEYCLVDAKFIYGKCVHEGVVILNDYSDRPTINLNRIRHELSVLHSQLRCAGARLLADRFTAGEIQRS